MFYEIINQGNKEGIFDVVYPAELSAFLMSAYTFVFNDTYFRSTCSTAFAAGLDKATGETPSGIPFSKMESEIGQYVSKHIGKTTPDAAVAVVKNGEIIFLKGYGYTQIE